MNLRPAIAVAAACAALAASGCSRGQPPPPFERAIAPRAFSFPADHGSHPAFKTEWWYLTGLLRGEDEKEYGFQLTFFRVGRHLTPEESPLRRHVLVQSVHYHGSWSDLGSGFFLYDEARGIDLQRTAAASSGRLDLRVDPHQLTDAGDGSWRAQFDVQGLQFNLEFRPSREPVLHGREPGLSVKGHEPGESSYYYSITRMTTTGSVRQPGAARSIRLEGESWFDHEFGTGQQGAGQIGWDWFSIRLSDGSDLMVYALRLRDGSLDTTSAGTLLHPDGTSEHLPHDAFAIESTRTWTSPHTGAVYPAAWRIRVPSRDIDLAGNAVVADQELQTPRTTQVTYWEGPARFMGTHRGAPVTGAGYVELVGYAKPLERVF